MTKRYEVLISEAVLAEVEVEMRITMRLEHWKRLLTQLEGLESSDWPIRELKDEARSLMQRFEAHLRGDELTDGAGR